MSAQPATQAVRWTVPVGHAETPAVFEPAAGGGGDVLVLAHGAGSHMDHPATVEVAEALRRRGLGIVRFDFLYRALRSGRPDPMPGLQACYRAVVESLRPRVRPARLFLGGRSLGGRTASMLAADGFACDGLVLLAYPLHAAGQTGNLRAAHLSRIAVPVLCVNGTRDALCRRDLMEGVLGMLPATFSMHWIEGADHGFHVLKRSGRTNAEVLEEVGDAVGSWVKRVTSSGH